MIRANVHTADDTLDVDFNAQPWFEQASYDEVCALLRGNCEGEAADDLVFWFQHRNPEIAALIDFVNQTAEATESHGHYRPEERALNAYLFEAHADFECSVNRSDVLRWLAVHRPEWDSLACAPAQHKGRRVPA